MAFLRNKVAVLPIDGVKGNQNSKYQQAASGKSWWKFKQAFIDDKTIWLNAFSIFNICYDAHSYHTENENKPHTIEEWYLIHAITI